MYEVVQYENIEGYFIAVFGVIVEDADNKIDEIIKREFDCGDSIVFYHYLCEKKLL